MLVDELTLLNSSPSQAALDELGVDDGVGPKSAPLHGFHGCHGSREVSLVAEFGELLDQSGGC